MPLIYLDTNIFVHAFERVPLHGREISNELVMFLARKPGSTQPAILTSQFTFAELWVKPYQVKNDDLINLYDNLAYSSNFIEVHSVDLVVLRGAAVLRSRYPSLKMPDALHISTAIRHQCKYFLTSDLRIKETYETIIDRLGDQRRMFTTTVVRPDIETLDRLTVELAAYD